MNKRGHGGEGGNGKEKDKITEFRTREGEWEIRVRRQRGKI